MAEVTLYLADVGQSKYVGAAEFLPRDSAL